ncbi:NAD(P)H-quinone oxidoreductase subunit 5 [Synechococcus sp. Cruz-9H2]|uniref:NAD(P)H-quinone oxidoreductase subunit 5 n=1 Tax=unclassified Synechococcus TaxID=2626047 RepID=UPI0020CD39DA|nr:MULTISPECIES: NAD(P)H-quinone oxidoreductase subunit 5 [unclassified Synechococcus]MCP9820505.1 NAD(P)H-quinone oxidoreductase subunit 5 [Synechococcus sp. Cruz-9H2]MCP9843298.1 NAD(P)H-quinone oxidoreductase subunit 5 [Synechococcus sp. Edmonson 11F2]MCP9855043.1 NAD(P)H-quinone oxidoreductase subunit 5 [Synechococcus sp. Cruz-9C9]MCP9862486.1 NAD(P)H-quinone oxidoreductase subunit 5 [Synechococcus sp. Cruz-7E5]MCP9871395.1 NAD(P)H-quinone oxidoreductase subunit 5 [Synechococcus sp. Cruz-7
MTSAAELAWLIPVLPLAGAAITGLGLISFNRTVNRLRKPVALLLISCVGAAAVLSFAVLAEQLAGAPATEVLFDWASAGSFNLQMGFRVDALGAVMLSLVTTIALLVMVYSDGYMAHDKGYVRFFTYLALFSSSMLGLVISPNLLEIYVFWELVGMCSYLLVGFWYDRDGAANAAQKAFVVNRVGDFGLLLGILGLFWATGSFGFEEIGSRLADAVAGGSLSNGAAVLLCLLVFMGPMAKSAQFPLHVWLPDAMEGPTPISALIHAATMVAAGVFLVARLQPVYAPFPQVQLVIAVVGTITCFLGASIALTQMDLKKGLAYSTVSQLGYMMLAMGCGAPVAGMFHLVTHAFFKAMLFLGSGSVIHAMEEVVGHEPVLAQDMRLMGGLRQFMPVTAITFLIGCVAISGIPPLAGFWSKDEILGQAFNSYPVLWVVGFLTAGMTAFYMFRLYFLTFEGEFRGNDAAVQAQLLKDAGKVAPGSDGEGDGASHGHHASHPHESGWQMALPLAVLAVPSALIGLLGTPWHSRFAGLLDPQEAAEMAEHFSWAEFLPLAGASVAISITGITIAVLAYSLHKLDLASLVAARFPSLNAFLANKWYLDDLNDKLFVQGSRKLARQVLEVDAKVVDGVVNLTGLLTLGSGEGLKYFETGRAQFYALIVFGGVIALVVLFSSF